MEVAMKLVIGNKGYSSWSQRAWLLMKVLDLPFEEIQVPLYQPDSKARILAISPNGKVPCLVDGDVTVWESLAIIEYLAERYPNKAVWPSDRAARAYARAISAEMHAGFVALRSAYTCNWRRTYAWKIRDDGAALKDGERIMAIWNEARRRFGAGGPFLFGAFSGADAMYAPIVARFHTYSWPVDAASAAYMEAIRSLPAYVAWEADGQAEPWTIAVNEYQD
jgi:glutathione S-transferase